jgi:hypothetical protein
MADGDMGTERPDDVGVEAAARLAAEGDVAGCRPGTSTGGAGCADGNCGSAVRATAEASGAASVFHQAQRGPDWHPIVATRSMATVDSWAVVVFISALPADRSPA